MEKLESDLEGSIITAKAQASFREYILKEAKQAGVVYHFTILSNLPSILQSGKLKTSDNNTNGLKFLSLTRDFQLPDNPNSYFKNCDVRFVLDGDKISNNIRVLPFHDELYDDESEEVVFKSLKLSKYLKNIDVKIPKMSFIDTEKIIKLGKKYNIIINIVNKWLPAK